MKAKLAPPLCKPDEVDIVKEAYVNNGALALEAYDKEGPYCTLSVNFPESACLPKNQCYFKNWSENEGMLERLEAQGLVRRLGPTMASGFVQAPLVEVLF